MNGPFFVYILASQRNGTLYVGVTNNLARRMSEHKAKLVPGLHQKIWCRPAGPFRGVRFHSWGPRARTFSQAVAARLEDQIDRRIQSRLERSDEPTQFL